MAVCVCVCVCVSPQDKAASALQLSRYSVVLTTYGTLAQDAPAAVRNRTAKGAAAAAATAKKVAASAAAGSSAGNAREASPYVDEFAGLARSESYANAFGVKKEEQQVSYVPKSARSIAARHSICVGALST